MRPFHTLFAFQMAVSGATALSSTTIPLVSTEFGAVFDAPVKIGNQTFQLLVDTGSSDTYVMKFGYTCINATDNLEIPRGDCLYSNKTYHKSSTYKRIPNQIFGIQYGAGLASGIMALEDVSIGDVTTKCQKIAIADHSNPMGDEVSSGLLGLAYPSITSAHPANKTDNTTFWFNRLPYNPLVNTMHQQGLIEPYFSLALSRSPQNKSTAFGGYLTLGGLPPVNHSPEFAVVPAEITETLPLNYTSGKRVRSYWTTTIREVTFGLSLNNLTTNLTSFQAFVDSGNYLTYLPSAVVDPINALFDPSATYNPEYEAYIVDCAAKAPEFGLKIGNQTFFHNGSDLIFQTSAGVCMSSLVSSESVSIGDVTLNILGVSFLKNVVAVFDFGRNEMRFAKRLSGNGNSTEGSGIGRDASSFSAVLD
ncbi:hypothetical protein PENARI_c006G05815 [Penicillium arizonense]|uniref:penicillopepsin n=1 Tax=Penicillium arizonense TaxID=1835702 RepID=A0A1F5LM34_PENAI|nr:hypothetical protein PENARI_c006G05815 [Penicillium arizonense]OGE54264.1 hypothetical protein PENARI_c006G05815 [Penicillium arizonense]